MEKSLEDGLDLAVLAEDLETVSDLLTQGANPNKIVSNGKTCLGEAASTGNIDVLKLLVSGSKKSHTASTRPYSVSSEKRNTKCHKRKIKHHTEGSETVVKVKNLSDKSFKEHSQNKITGEKTEEDGNQGYFVVIHNDGSSSDEGKNSNLKSPTNPPSLAPSPDLEWDEEIGNVAPTTTEDEKWSSIYKWYAAILESTGAAIASASGVNNGIDQQDAFTRTPLHYAVEKGHVDAVKLLVDAGCKIDIPGSDGFNALHVAVIRNYMDIVKILIQARGSVNYKTHDKMTPLHFAASRGFMDIVKLLVTNGAFLEARDTNERTALYIATGRGHVDIVKYLIAAGANVNGEEIHGYSPLCEAVWQKNIAIVEPLLLSGARIIHSHRLLHVAIMRKEDHVLKLLTDYGGGINLPNENGDTPLLLAVRSKQLGAVKILLAKGANANACNSITGSNALHIAVESDESVVEFEELLRCLSEHKIDMDATALTGDTPLNRALLLFKRHAAVLLIRYGADVNTCDLHSCGLDNLSIACRQSSVIASMLIKAGHFVPKPDPTPTVLMPNSLEFHLYANRKPLGLSDLCRIEIRRMAKNQAMHRFISMLPLPKSLKRFLMMEDEGLDFT